MNVVSFGGGTNSAAMIIGMNQRGIPIDLILFSDTGVEKPGTYDFINAFNEWLCGKGLPEITTVQKSLHGEPYTLEQFCLRYGKMPSVVYGRKQCSVEFKIEPMEKFCNKHEPFTEAWKRGEKVSRYTGYDAGEKRRIEANGDKYNSDKKYLYYFPLMDWKLSREDCVSLIKDAGLPPAGKSSCFFCPNNKKEEIIKLWENHPDLFRRAVAIEQNAGKTRKDGTPSAIIGLGREWTWEEYIAVYEHNKAFDKSQIIIEGFNDNMGGCCCGMPCGCYDG